MEKNVITEVYQVCYNLTQENKDREINGLLEAMDYFNINNGIILTFNQKYKFIVNRKNILVIPTWEWLK